MKGIADSFGLRIVGPNCLGYIAPRSTSMSRCAHHLPRPVA